MILTRYTSCILQIIAAMSSHPSFFQVRISSPPQKKKHPPIRVAPPQSNKFLLPAGKVCQWSAPQPPFLEANFKGQLEKQRSMARIYTSYNVVPKQVKLLLKRYVGSWSWWCEILVNSCKFIPTLRKGRVAWYFFLGGNGTINPIVSMYFTCILLAVNLR